MKQPKSALLFHFYPIIQGQTKLAHPKNEWDQQVLSRLAVQAQLVWDFAADLVQKGWVEPCVGVQVISKSSSGPSKATRLGFLLLPLAKKCGCIFAVWFQIRSPGCHFPSPDSTGCISCTKEGFCWGRQWETDCNLSQKKEKWSISSERLWKGRCGVILKSREISCGDVDTVSHLCALNPSWKRTGPRWLCCVCCSPQMWIHWKNNQLSVQACQNLLCRVTLCSFCRVLFYE